MKIGIFGGTFDPVHLGHIGLAQDAIEQVGLDQVIFIPAGIQPFKQDKRITSGEDRIQMLRLAVEGDPELNVSDFEIKRAGVSYTYLTLRELYRQYEQEALSKGDHAHLYFICGTDSFLKLETWANGTELLSSYSFIIGSRPGYKQKELTETIDRVKALYGTDAVNIHNRLRNISATEIRERIARGSSISDLVPEPVESYIAKHGLYLDFASLKNKVMDYINTNLKASRRDHSLRVAKEAIHLAELYGADVHKAEVAALMHDMAKNLEPSKMNQMVEDFGLPKRYKNNSNLAHGKLAEQMIPGTFGVRDQDILHAVSFHTTGREGMSQLEKVIFLADAIEPGRKFPGVSDIRKLAETNLDEACLLMLSRTISFIQKKGDYLDPDTLRARDYFLNKRREAYERT